MRRRQCLLLQTRAQTSHGNLAGNLKSRTTQKRRRLRNGGSCSRFRFIVAAEAATDRIRDSRLLLLAFWLPAAASDRCPSASSFPRCCSQPQRNSRLFAQADSSGLFPCRINNMMDARWVSSSLSERGWSDGCTLGFGTTGRISFRRTLEQSNAARVGTSRKREHEASGSRAKAAGEVLAAENKKKLATEAEAAEKKRRRGSSAAEKDGAEAAEQPQRQKEAAAVKLAEEAEMVSALAATSAQSPAEAAIDALDDLTFDVVVVPVAHVPSKKGAVARSRSPLVLLLWLLRAPSPLLTLLLPRGCGEHACQVCCSDR